MHHEQNQARLLPENYRLLISENQIQSRLAELGKAISTELAGDIPILIGVLNGGFIFLADLIRYIDIDVEMDFIRISSYGNQRESTGHVKVLKPLSADIRGRAVVVVEDIVDSGNSLVFLKEMLEAFRPKVLKFASLLNKPSKNVYQVKIDYLGFDIEDKFVVGYGLDDEQLKRNLRGIYYIS